MELTRRSKSFTSRHNGSSTRGKKLNTFVKGQRAFYRSTRGIEKVTVVGVHHDAKLVPYYTIQLRDRKEKQTDGKHLNHVKDDVVGKGGGSSQNDDKEKSGISESDRGDGVGSGGKVEAEGGGSKSTGSDNDTDPMTESSRESNIKVEVMDCGGKLAQGRSGEEISSHENNNQTTDHGTKQFTEGHDAYYRSPDGIITKVRIKKSLHRDTSPKKKRYTITLPDGSHVENVTQSHLATLVELSSKELSLLMKERNKQQPSSTGPKSHNRPIARRSSSSTHEDNIATVKGGDFETQERLASSTSELSESFKDLDIKNKSESTSQAKPPFSPSETNEKQTPPQNAPTVRMVQAKTEDGKFKTVPKYEVGMTLNYKNAAGVQECTILSVYLDDLLEPFYDVQLKDGHEKQTDNAHLMLKSDNVDEDAMGDKQDAKGAKVEVRDVSNEEEKCHALPKEQHHSLNPSGEKTISPSSSKKDIPEDSGDNGCSDSTNRSDIHQLSKEDTTSASLTNSTVFSTGNEVIYTSSEGEQIRAKVLKLHHDKKNRPYYVVRLHLTGKEKQVYGHRLQLLCSPQDSDEQPHSQRSRSRSRGGERGRSTSKATKSEEGNRQNDPAPRSESIDSRRSSLSNSSRRAADRKEILLTRRERDVSRTRDRHTHDPIGTTSRSRSMSALRQGRTQGKSSGGGAVESRGSRDRSHSRTRGEGKERALSRAPGEGRERSRSRVPGESSRERPCSRAPSEDSRASLSTSRSKQSLPNSKKLNSSAVNVGSSSNQLSSKGPAVSIADSSSSKTGRSIAKLKNFRRSFSAMKKS